MIYKGIKSWSAYGRWLEHPLKVIQDYMIPMRQEIEWGYMIPYMVTGILNEHPRSAIAYRQTDDKDKYAEFYEKMRLPQE